MKSLENTRYLSKICVRKSKYKLKDSISWKRNNIMKCKYFFTIVSNNCWSSEGPGKRGHIVADPFARARNICCGYKFCVRDTKTVSDFVQKHFVSATNVSQFAQPKKHHEQQCVCNIVSSFARAFNLICNHACLFNHQYYS